MIRTLISIVMVIAVAALAVTDIAAAGTYTESVFEPGIRVAGSKTASLTVAPTPQPWIAPSWVSLVPAAYWKLHGEWPACWGEIEADGLFDAELLTIHGEVIDPDSGEWDHAWDVKYMPNADGDPSMAYISLNHGSNVHVSRITRPSHTWAERFQHKIEQNEEVYGEYRQLIEDPALMRQYTVYQLAILGLGNYQRVFRKVPADFNTYLESGCAPISPDTINPLTGEPYVGDGRPNDFKYWIDEHGRASLAMTDEYGDTPWGG